MTHPGVDRVRGVRRGTNIPGLIGDHTPAAAPEARVFGPTARRVRPTARSHGTRATIPEGPRSPRLAPNSASAARCTAEGVGTGAGQHGQVDAAGPGGP